MILLTDTCSNCNGTNITAVRIWPIEYGGYWCSDCEALTDSWKLDGQEIEGLGKLIIEETNDTLS